MRSTPATAPRRRSRCRSATTASRCTSPPRRPGTGTSSASSPSSSARWRRPRGRMPSGRRTRCAVSRSTMDDYLANPLVADPLRKLDCCLVNDGGVAFVMTSLERARDLPPPPRRRGRRRLRVEGGAAVRLLQPEQRPAHDGGHDLRAEGLSPGRADTRRRRRRRDLRLLHRSRCSCSSRTSGSPRRAPAPRSPRRAPSRRAASLPVNTHGGLLCAVVPRRWQPRRRGRPPAPRRARRRPGRRRRGRARGRPRSARARHAAAHERTADGVAPLRPAARRRDRRAVLGGDRRGAGSCCRAVRRAAGGSGTPTRPAPTARARRWLWEQVATTGTVHTATRVERAFLPGGHADVPYVVAFVELDGVDGVRLVANLADDTAVAIGDRVQASFVDFGDRRHLVFVPA